MNLARAFSLLFLSSIAFAYPAQLVSISTCTAAGQSCGMPITASKNDVLLVVMCAQRATAAALTLVATDSLVNTYSAGFAELDGGTSTAGMAASYAINNAGTANVVTCTRTGATNQKITCITADLRAIMAPTTPLDGGVRQTVSATTVWNSGLYQMAVADYLTGMACHFNDSVPTWTAGPGYAIQKDVVGNNLRIIYEDTISSGVFNTSASLTASVNVTGIMGAVALRERINRGMGN